MTLFDRYLSGEFAQAVFAALVVLLMVSLGGIAADILGEIAGGRVPASMLLTQLGLRLVRYLPMILPLALLLGLMLAAGRLYRDSEMPVLISLGIGPKRMLVPLMLVVAPVVGFIAACSLWLGPMADRMAQTMIQQANRNLLIAGLEPGKFTELPGGGVVYVGAMSGDGTALQRVFVYRQNEERLDVTTARAGQMRVESGGERFLTLAEGFRVEGPLHAGKNYRLMRYASNELQLPKASAPSAAMIRNCCPPRGYWAIRGRRRHRNCMRASPHRCWRWRSRCWLCRWRAVRRGNRVTAACCSGSWRTCSAPC